MKFDMNMRILGIHAGHNGGAALLDGPDCAWVVGEEKLTNKKNQGGIPVKVIRLLAERGLLKDLGAVALSSEFYLADAVEGAASEIQTASTGRLRNLYNWTEYNLESALPVKSLFRALRNHLYSRLSVKMRSQIVPLMSELCGVTPDRIHFLDHHTTHCLTPYYFYGLQDHNEPILSISIDGDGDRLSGRILKIHPGKTPKVEQVASTSYDASLGYFYSHVTSFLGMKPMEHEYKVMGLAAYPDEKYYLPLCDKFRKIIWVDEERLQIGSQFNLVVMDRFLRENFVGQRFDNIAAAAQRFLEEAVIKLVKAAIKKTGVTTLAFSGGVFMNVKMNHRLLMLPEVKQAFFMPSCGDESLPIGAVGSVAAQHGNRMQPVRNMCLGVRYTSAEAGKFLESYQGKYKITQHPNIEDVLAKLLADFKVVARFKGPGEWGARSLGNRAILANPSDFAMFHEVNDSVKMRDFWMPFAPTILEEWADKYLADWEQIKAKGLVSSRYMIVASQSTPLARKHLRAAMHQKDGSIRPQLIRRETNPDYYSLVEKFSQLTGIGGVLNTSFNLHGYPLVGTLAQAMFTFENSKLKYLAIEDYLLEKLDANVFEVVSAADQKTKAAVLAERTP